MSTGNPLYSRRFPQHGTIEGGKLDGWNYAFLRFHPVRVRGGAVRLVPLVRATPPAWPFPQDVMLLPRSFHRLRSAAGVRTPSVDSQEMIDAAALDWKAEHPS